MRKVFGSIQVVKILLSSSPFVYQVGYGDGQGQKETTSDNEEQFRHESPKVKKCYGESK